MLKTMMAAAVLVAASGAAMAGGWYAEQAERMRERELEDRLQRLEADSHRREVEERFSYGGTRDEPYRGFAPRYEWAR